MAALGAVTFGEFFLLTLYLQGVLRYSAVETGVAFSAFAGSVVVASNLAQRVVARIGVRQTLTLGLVLSAASIAYLTRLPIGADYFGDLFPAFIVGGSGLGLSFVPVTISSLQGIGRSDAGVASGLINTSRQIGGAVGLAAVTAIAATSTGHAASSVSLDHGYQTALYALTGLSVLAAVAAATLLRAPQPAEHEIPSTVRLEEAA